VRKFKAASKSYIAWGGACALGLPWLGDPVAAWGQTGTAQAPAPPAAAAPATAPTAPAAGDLLTLEQAVDLAIQNNRQVQNTARQVSANQRLVSATKTGRLPEFGLGFLGQYSFTNDGSDDGETLPPVGPIPVFTSSETPSGFFVASATQKVLGLKTVNLNVKLQETAVATSQEEVRLRQQEVRTAVKRVYYQLIENQTALAANEESIRYYRELERVVGDRVRQQTALQAELLEVQARRSAQEHESVVLRNQAASLQEQLNYLMGRDVQTPFRVGTVTDVAAPAQDQAALQTLALERRPELRQASLGVRTAQLNEELARQEMRPTLSVGFQYTYSSIEFGNSNDDASVGLLFRWEPFDWGRRRDQIRAQQLVVQQQQTSLEDGRAQVIMDVNSRYRTLQSTRNELAVTRAVQEAARERVRLELDRYAQRTVLLSDALLAQSALAEANRRNQEALSAYLTAVAELSRAIGEN
jgi:outer membrane protein TolC